MMFRAAIVITLGIKQYPRRNQERWFDSSAFRHSTEYATGYVYSTYKEKCILVYSDGPSCLRSHPSRSSQLEVPTFLG